MLRYINYEILNKNATDFSNYSNELNSIINVFKERLANIDTNWQSKNKVNFEAVVNKTINNMQVDSNKMKRHSNILLNAKDNFKNHDLTYNNSITNDIYKGADKRYG